MAGTDILAPGGALTHCARGDNYCQYRGINPLGMGVSAGFQPPVVARHGYIHVPYSSTESIIAQDKESYYLALRQTQGTIQTDWQP